jgi:hypothetical protein
VIIFCGGKTDVFKPYKRNEADEMKKFFIYLIKQKQFLKQITKNWDFVSEKISLSTLENLIESKKIIVKRKISKANIFIFCEQTRGNRIKIIAKKVFDKNHNAQIIPIDFDISSNRYLPINFIAKKEKAELKHSLWALKNKNNFKKYHKIFEEKIKYLRSTGTKNHAESVKKWWDKKLADLEN